MQFSPLATAHPSVPNTTWTKISTKSGINGRKYLLIVNEDATNTFRIETCCTATQVAALLATSGFKLSPGGSYEETANNQSTGDVYAYQASGGALTSLAVKEGV